MAKKIMSSGFDLNSSPISRISRHYLLSRCVPMGCYQQGAGMKCLIILSLTHCFGRPIFWLATRFEPQVVRLNRIREKLSL